MTLKLLGCLSVAVIGIACLSRLIRRFKVVMAGSAVMGPAASATNA